MTRGKIHSAVSSLLIREPTKQGIRAMFDLQRSEELERLDHERGVISAGLKDRDRSYNSPVTLHKVLIQSFFLLVILI